jgi:Protein of unknown function (DUF1003)
LHQERTRGERLADAIVTHIGSCRFLIIQTIAVILWIAINVVAAASGWDRYPFVLLNLFSVLAAYTGAVLPLSQNRSAKRDRMIVDLDFTNNEKGEQLVGALLNERPNRSPGVRRSDVAEITSPIRPRDRHEPGIAAAGQLSHPRNALWRFTLVRNHNASMASFRPPLTEARQHNQPSASRPVNSGPRPCLLDVGFPPGDSTRRFQGRRPRA